MQSENNPVPHKIDQNPLIEEKPKKKRGRKKSPNATTFCDICEKLYSSVSKYNRHFKENHAKDRMIHKCKVCSKVFKRRSHLNRHIMALHLNQKHQCPLCVTRFLEKRALTTHLKNSHNSYRCLKCEIVFPFEKKRSHVCDSKLISDSWKNAKICQICNRSYQRYGYLKKHIIEAHIKAKGINEKERKRAKELLERNLDAAEQIDLCKKLKDEDDIDLLKEGIALIPEDFEIQKESVNFLFFIFSSRI